MNLQDNILNQVRKDNAEIKLILMDGTKLTGQVKGFDNFTVIMACGPTQHMIYKHAIAQIVQERPAARAEETAVPAKVKGQDGNRNAPKPEGFNTLDLSRVQLPQPNS